MKEFVEKLIERLEENQNIVMHFFREPPKQTVDFPKALEIINQLAEEYNNDFCEWTYDEFEEKWQTDCEVLFALNDSDREITHYCPYCGKKIKIAPYQPEGE